MVAHVVPLFGSRERKRDWSAEETAEFYRIEHALIQAGLSLQTDHGITDEGDPWFVFCRSDGEVFVHITRLDGEYQLHSPALPCPLKGRVFTDLSKAFINQTPLHIPAQRPGQSKLFVHPAATLAIVIGTILIASEDNFGFAPSGAHVPDGSVETAPSDRTAPTYPKSALQGAFLKLAETYFGVTRAHLDSLESNYLNIIAAIVACVAGVTTTTDISQALIEYTIVQDLSQDQPLQTHAPLLTPGNGDNGLDVTHLTAIETFHMVHNDEQIIEAQPNDSFGHGAHLIKITDVALITDSHPASASSHAVDQQSVITFERTLAEEGVKLPIITAQPQIVSVSLAGQGENHSSTPAVVTAAVVTMKVQPDAVTNSSDQTAHQLNPGPVPVSDALRNAALNEPLNTASSAAPATEHMSLEQIVNNATAGPHPAYDAKAEAALIAFWGANPLARAVYDQQNIVVYDGTTPPAAATVQVWELGHGAVIAVVGHADSPTGHV